jgi:hypothetical protein
MQFVVLVKATADSEAEIFRPEQFAEMGAFNDRLGKDGVLLAAEGLQPSSKGVRLRFDEGRTTVTDGPFTETKELVSGFWIVQGNSKSEVVERFMHAPFDRGQEIEIRQVYQIEDFSPDMMTAERREANEEITLSDLARLQAEAP